MLLLFMEITQDPLKGLIFNDTEVDRGMLFEILQPYVGFGKSGEIIFKGEYGNLRESNKLLILLLCQKAKKLLGLSETEALKPATLHELSGVNYSSVRSYLSQFASQKSKKIIKDKGEYRVPNYAIISIKKEVLEHD